MTNELAEVKNLTEMWKFYTEYYIEKFGEVLTESEQKERMRTLDKLAEGNEQKAIQILEVMICEGEKTIYMPESYKFA
jgi:hypothetical protein